MRGGSTLPINRSIKQACNLLGCKVCLEGSDSRQCSQCEDGWQRTPEGACECDVGFGTYVTTAFDTSLSYSGFSSVQPADACLYRVDNPICASPRRRDEHCSGANPRVIQNMFVDPPECQCRACPVGWTSAGGPPNVASCYPEVLPRYFKMEMELTTPNNYSQYDSTPLSTAESVMEALAQTVVASSVRRCGALVLQPPTGEAPRDLIFGVQPQDTSVFATIYTFNGTEAELAALTNAMESCRVLGDPSGCAFCRWNLCEVFNSTAPSSVLYKLFLSAIPTSLYTGQPIQILPFPQRRQLTVQASSPFVSFLATVFGNGGKLSQLFKDGKFRELGGLGFGTAFTVVGFIMSFFGDSSSSDPNKELLKSINQTVTATYQAVLQIQDELHTIANQLGSLQDQIATAFNALNTEILTTQCISSFGTLSSGWMITPRKPM